MPLLSKKQDQTEKRLYLSDGWAEGPLAHGKFTTSTHKENEFFMQWVHPIKLHRVALRTPIGYRVTHGKADDVINDDLGIKIPNQKEITDDINQYLRPYLKSINWIKEMRKFKGNLDEQGEAILYLMFDEEINQKDDTAHLQKPIHENAEIIGIEAFNLVNYKIIRWDEYGDPAEYVISMKNPFMKGTRGIPVDASRVMRFCKKELDERETGYPILAVIYDNIVIATNITKAAGEAAFRWGTGHPLILTKNVTTDDEILRIKNFIGIPTRRNWHILPSEFIEKFELIGQAGQMLNLKALHDIAMDNIVMATKIPKSVFLGEAQVVQGEVEERQYYGTLYEDHVELDPFVRDYFSRDINIRKLLNDNPLYEIDWGIRETLSKMDEMEYRQRNISNALALTTFCTVNECRKEAGFPPLDGPEGELIIGVDQLMASMGMMGGQSDEAIAMGQQDKSTVAMSKTGKDLEKDKTIQKNKLRENKKKVKDAIESLRVTYSVDDIAKMLSMSKGSVYKIIDWADNG